MTTEAFNRTNPYAIKALTAIKREHCGAPNFAPPEPVASQRECPKCKGRLGYTVDTQGRTSAKCVTASCVKWSLQ